jgi:hypothetical protein
MATTTFSGPIRAGTVREGASANVGNVVLSQTGSIAYTDDGTAVAIGTIPASSQIIEIYVDVTTAFDGTGTDLVDLGDGTTANLYADNLDVASAARVLASSDASQLAELADVGTSDVTVYATYTDSNGDAAAGAATITILYKQN